MIKNGRGLLEEEIRANAAADALHRRLVNYEQSRSSWSLLKRAKHFFGLYTNSDGRKIAAISEGRVLGAGLGDKSKRLPKHAVITEKEDPVVGGTVHVYRYPLSFIIYISDSVNNSESHLFAYADDTTLIATASSTP